MADGQSPPLLGMIKPMEPFRKTLTLPHIQLSYLEWFTGPEPVLLLHGLGDHARVWSDLAISLGNRYHLVALDMRGHGESGKPTQGYTFTELIGDLEALLDHLGWSQVHGIAHSWTAKLLPIWATSTPQRLASMVLVDPFYINKMPGFVNFTFPLLYKVLPFLQGMGPFSSYEVAEAKAQTLNQFQGWSPLQQKVFAEGIEQKADGSWGSKFTVPARNEIFQESVAVSGLTAPIDIPTLLVQPEQGINRRASSLKTYQTYLNQLQVERLSGNHWPFLVEAERFNPAVIEFLRLHPLSNGREGDG